MDKLEFSKIRRYLGKTQDELARLLCISPKAIQSFEQGWRNVSTNAERQMLFLQSLKRSSDNRAKACWEFQNCPQKWRDHCPVWEYKVGNFCWFINGTYCQGQYQGDWENKIKLCRECKVFQHIMQ